MIWHFRRRGRSPGAITTVALVWVTVLAFWLGLGLTAWIAVPVLALTLPAIWDALRDARAEVQVWPGRLVWQATFSAGESADIDHVRLNRRFDGSMRVTIMHPGGATTRLPPDIAPPTARFEAAMKEAGITVQRHPFLPF